MGLDTVELLYAIEEDFDLEIPDEVAEKLETAGDICAYLQAHFEQRRGPLGQKATDALWERVKQLIVQHLGVAPERVTRDAHIVRDLGAD